MARGKQAVRSANRRVESLHEINTRLTNELVEAKLRARQYEQSHLRLPIIETALREAVRDRDLSASPALRRLEARLHDLEAERDGAIATAAQVLDRWEHISTWLRKRSDDEGVEFIESVIVEAFGADPRTTLTLDTQTKGLSVEAVRRIQRARGLRK